MKKVIFNTISLLLILFFSYINAEETKVSNLKKTQEDFKVSTLSLSDGWNLISANIPLKNITDKINIIWQYDTNSKWSAYSANQTTQDKINDIVSISTINNISIEKGSWVYSSEEDIIYIEEVDTSSLNECINVKQGWNLLGTALDIDVEEYFQDSSKVNIVWTYESSTQTWSAFSADDTLKNSIKETSDNISLLSTINKNKGFWLKSLVSECLPISKTVQETTLQEINLSLTVKGNNSVPSFGDGGIVEITQNPLHGSVEAYLVGNEVPYIKYTSTDCFVGSDSFIYKSGDEYGLVNVTITNPSSVDILNETKTLYNTETITGEYLRAKSGSENVEITTTTQNGDSSLTVVGNEVINYNYNPEDTFVGNDYFEYSVSETINECSYSKTGRIDFIVKSLAPVVTTPTKAAFRTLLSSDNPKDNDQFASGVAIEGDTIVIGVPGYQIDGTGSRGEIIVYQKTENAVEEIQHIKNPDLQSDFINRRFGYSVALKDGFLAVVAPGMQTISNKTTIYSNITKVYIYKQEEDNTFTYIQTFDAITNNTNSYFAYNNIAINKNYLLIGAANETIDGKQLAGAVYVYERFDDKFAQTPVLLSDINSLGDGFANKVALMDDLILVSLPKKKVYEEEGDTQRYGAVNVYKDKGSGLELVSIINSPKLEVDSYAYSAYFGSSLAVDENMLAIGIPNATVDELTEVGYVDVYMRSGDNFVLLSRISDSNPVQGENFGSSIAIENPYLIVSSTATSNSNGTSKADTTQIYQYTAGESQYTKLDEFEHIPTHNTWLKFQERANFGAELDISNGTIISSSEYAFNFSKLQSRSYRAGQAYLLEVDMQRPYWVDYKSSIIQPDNISSISANISKPDNMEFVSSGVGEDSALFTYDMNYINYGVMGNIEECYSQCETEECFMMCEEQSAISSELDFYTPIDANGDNKYEVDMKLTYDGNESIYPITWEVKDMMSITQGYNDGVSYFHYNYNRLQLEGIGSTSYASELLFEDEKAYVRSNDSIFIYNKNLSLPELLDYDGKISISDIPSSTEINMEGVTSFYKGSMASFDVENSRIATISTHTEKTTIDNKTKYETDSYIHLFNNTEYVESIVVHKDNQNIFPCEDDKVCDVNHKNLLGVQLENGIVFAAYQNQNTYHDDELISYKKWENENQHYESGVMIYTYDGSKYNLKQTIEIPADSNNISQIHSFKTDGDFLLINGSHNTDDDYNPNRYIKVYKFNGTDYSLLQSFDLPSYAGTNWTATVENAYVLIENQRIGYTNLDTYIYQYDENNNIFALIDTITNEEAGATYTDGYKGVHIQVDEDGTVYLYKRFYKRLETKDATSDFIANAAYIGIFKQDKTSKEFRFVDSFTHRDGSNYFADSFAIDGDIVISNTSNTGYLHSFKLLK